MMGSVIKHAREIFNIPNLYYIDEILGLIPSPVLAQHTKTVVDHLLNMIPLTSDFCLTLLIQ